MNMTRKSLAIVSAVSLAVIGLSAPAGAAGLSDKSFVSLEPSSGDNYSVVAFDGQTFSLTANEASSIDAVEDLKFLVTDADAEVFPTAATTGVSYANLPAVPSDWVRDSSGNVTVTVAAHALAEGEMIFVAAGSLTHATAASGVDTGYFTVTDVVDANNFTFNDGKTVVVLTAASTLRGTPAVSDITTSAVVRDADDNSFVVDSGIQTSATDEDLVLIVQSDDTVMPVVTAWVDNNDDGAINATEYTSEARTVAFHGVADLTPSITWALQFGVAPSAVITFAEPLNVQQTASADFVGAMVNTGAAQTVTESWSSTTAKLTLTGNVALAVEGNLTLTLNNADGSEIAEFVSGVTDLDVAYFTASVVKTNNAVNGADPVQTADFTATVRTDESATVIVTAFDSSGDPVSGVAITIDDDGVDNNISGANTFTVNGKKVAADGTYDSSVLTTNADGEVTFAVAAVDDTTVGDDITVDFTAEGVTKGLDDDGEVTTDNANNEITLTWADANYAATVVSIVDAKTTNSANATSDGIRSNSLPVQVRVVDQWSSTPANGKYRVEATIAQDSESDSAFVDVVNGTASFSVSDNADADGGLITATLDLQVYSTSTASFGDEDAAFATVYVQPFTSSITGLVTYTNDEPAAVAVGTDALVAANTKLGESAPDVGTPVSLAGTVKNSSNGATVKGASITLSGPSNLLFVADGVYSFGSITAIVGDAGDFTVAVYSTVSGEFTVTATSLGGSDEATVEFNSPLKTDGENLVVSVSNLSAGKTGTVSGSLTDQFGNGVYTATNAQLSITYTGPGLVVGDLPTDFDENGEFSFNVLMGSNDVVSGSVVVRYDKNDNASFTDTGTLTVSKALAAAEVASWTKKLDASSAKIYAKNIVGAGKVQFFLNGKEIAWVNASSAADSKLRTANGASYLVRTVDLVEGQKNVLEIFVDGVRTARSAYSY
tara:strand:+ start:95 stop:2938 length:2844 start_codon:yes stop_codon:yes gene_type:complete